MGELAESSTYGIVFTVIHRVLEEVTLADLMFAVISIRFVVVKVNLPEKSVVGNSLAIELDRKAAGLEDGSTARLFLDILLLVMLQLTNHFEGRVKGSISRKLGLREVLNTRATKLVANEKVRR